MGISDAQRLSHPVIYDPRVTERENTGAERTQADRAKVRLLLAQHAHNADDLRLAFSMCGLWPAQDTEARTVHWPLPLLPSYRE